jgi:hypothetical protein
MNPWIPQQQNPVIRDEVKSTPVKRARPTVNLMRFTSPRGQSSKYKKENKYERQLSEVLITFFFRSQSVSQSSLESVQEHHRLDHHGRWYHRRRCCYGFEPRHRQYRFKRHGSEHQQPGRSRALKC